MVENSVTDVHEKDSLLRSGRSMTHNLQSSSSKYCWPENRRLRSKGATVVLVWAYLVATSALHQVYQSASLSQDLDHYTLVTAVGTLAGVIIVPLAGVIATVYFGRYKLLCTSLWLTWIAKSVTVPILILQWLLPKSNQALFHYGVLGTELFCWIGVVFFVANAVPFGLDQMPDASGEQISAFIHWYAWTVLTGIVSRDFINDILLYTHVNYSAMLLSLYSVLSLSIALCSVLLLRKWLTIEPCGRNPLKGYFKVVAFAAKHKIPIRRSAFTYWEADKPSRIDLAKSKYGGPFTTEEVEDVKTCLRVLLVMITVSTAVIAVPSFHLSLDNTLVAEVLWQYLVGSVGFQAILCVVLILPVYEATVRPLIRRWIPSIMKRVGTAAIVIGLVNLVLLLLTTLQYTQNTTQECMLVTNKQSPFPVDEKWVVLPAQVITCFCAFCFGTAALEFVCAQAPYNMRGLLTGLVHWFLFLSAIFGTVIYEVWKANYQDGGANSPSCGVWFYLFTTTATILGCVLWCAVAKWYKNRERDEPEMCRIFAENYYDH